LETPVRVAKELARHGYNADRGAVTLIAEADDPGGLLEAVVAAADEGAFHITAEDVRAVRTGAVAGASGAEATAPSGSPDGDGREISGGGSPPRPSDSSDGDPTRGASGGRPESTTATDSGPTTEVDPDESDSPDPPGTAAPADPTAKSASSVSSSSTENPPVSTGTDPGPSGESGPESPVETKGSRRGHQRDPSRRSIEVSGDVTGRSTGTGEYDDFVTVFRDRYDRLSKKLRGRVNRRPAGSVGEMSPGSETAIVGLVNDVRSTASGHWLIELEDPSGVFPCLVMKDRAFADLVDELLLDECLAIEGTVSDDAGILFADAVHFPDVPRTYRPSTADRHVQAALVSDVHVGSQEFVAEAWSRFADWLHTEEARHVEYLLIAGDMVEGVGVYPDQDEELDIVDIYEQYEAFSERLKEVPGDMEVVMIPGNHDAVRLAEPQPGFDDELRDIMSAHDARIHGNPSLVTVEGVSVLMYHGVSLDEVIAELPEEKASYDDPHKAMYQLLKKRHVAPQYGGKIRLAPEERDYLVIDEVPDVFHTGHVHKLGWGKYHNVLAVNSGCWQAQTEFQRSVNIDPDVAHAPILDLDTLDMTVRKFI
jgi:DNA polymerase II small subunit